MNSSASTSPSRQTRSATRPVPLSRLSPTAGSPLSRTSASTPVRPRRTTPSAAPSPTSWRSWPICTWATASVPSTASTPRSSTCRPGCRTPRAISSPPRSVYSRSSPTDVKRPYAVVLGGAKVSDKLGVIDHLLERADRILIGGGMAYTFLKAQGHEVGNSLLQEDQIPAVLEYLQRAKEKGVEFVLPVDVVGLGAVPGHRGEDRDPPRHRRASTPSRPVRWVWTTARRPASCTPRSSPTRPPSSGTARWASSSTPTTPRAPGPWPRRFATAPAFTVVGGGDSAAAVRILGFDRERVRPHFDRWRREPRVPRGQDASRPCRTGGLNRNER